MQITLEVSFQSAKMTPMITTQLTQQFAQMEILTLRSWCNHHQLKTWCTTGSSKLPLRASLSTGIASSCIFSKTWVVSALRSETQPQTSLSQQELTGANCQQTSQMSDPGCIKDQLMPMPHILLAASLPSQVTSIRYTNRTGAHMIQTILEPSSQRHTGTDCKNEIIHSFEIPI